MRPAKTCDIENYQFARKFVGLKTVLVKLSQVKDFVTLLKVIRQNLYTNIASGYRTALQKRKIL